jgi:hypothetical protein
MSVPTVDSIMAEEIAKGGGGRGRRAERGPELSEDSGHAMPHVGLMINQLHTMTQT